MIADEGLILNGLKFTRRFFYTVISHASLFSGLFYVIPIKRHIEDGLINDRKRSRLFARIFNRIGLSSCNERARVAYIRIQMVVSFRMRHFLVYTTCLRYQRIEERVLKVGIDGRHTRYACHIVPGIDYNYGESIVHR